jgi:hypothetical protein
MAKKVLYSVIGVVVLIFISLLIIGLNLPPQQKTTTAATPVVATSSATVLDTQKVVATLTASVEYYSQLLIIGKAALDTTQYPNASVGLSALKDPNSSVSKFSAFRTDTCIKNDPGANAMNTYRNISDMYSVAHVQSPNSLDNWSYDTNTVASDICEWAGVAVDWQISKVTTAKLKAAEQKIAMDLATARADIQAIPK